MLSWRLRSFERSFDYDVSYGRDILDASLIAFLRFAPISALSAHRQDIPREAWYAAKLATTVAEDCGPCTQLVVTMAERDGVEPATLRAILSGDEATMSPDAALGFRFANAVLRRDLVDGDRLRNQVITRWGKRALVSLALTIAASRVFPAVKYALGHGKACARVQVGGSETEVTHATSAA